MTDFQTCISRLPVTIPIHAGHANKHGTVLLLDSYRGCATCGATSYFSTEYPEIFLFYNHSLVLTCRLVRAVVRTRCLVSRSRSIQLSTSTKVDRYSHEVTRFYCVGLISD